MAMIESYLDHIRSNRGIWGSDPEEVGPEVYWPMVFNEIIKDLYPDPLAFKNFMSKYELWINDEECVGNGASGTHNGHEGIIKIALEHESIDVLNTLIHEISHAIAYQHYGPVGHTERFWNICCDLTVVFGNLERVCSRYEGCSRVYREGRLLMIRRQARFSSSRLRRVLGLLLFRKELKRWR